MTATAIRRKLYEYIRVAEDKKVKAIYTMLELEIEEVYDHWKDKNFVTALQKRTADYKSGKVKAISWEKAKQKITKSTKKTAR